MVHPDSSSLHTFGVPRRAAARTSIAPSSRIMAHFRPNRNMLVEIDLTEEALAEGNPAEVIDVSPALTKVRYFALLEDDEKLTRLERTLDSCEAAVRATLEGESSSSSPPPRKPPPPSSSPTKKKPPPPPSPPKKKPPPPPPKK